MQTFKGRGYLYKSNKSFELHKKVYIEITNMTLSLIFQGRVLTKSFQGNEWD